MEFKTPAEFWRAHTSSTMGKSSAPPDHYEASLQFWDKHAHFLNEVDIPHTEQLWMFYCAIALSAYGSLEHVAYLLDLIPPETYCGDTVNLRKEIVCLRDLLPLPEGYKKRSPTEFVNEIDSLLPKIRAWIEINREKIEWDEKLGHFVLNT